MTQVDDILYSPIAQPVSPIPAELSELFASLGQYLTSYQKGFKFPNEAKIRSFYTDLATQYIAAHASDVLYSFSVLCDTTNNPPIVIQCSRIILDVFAKPLRSSQIYADRMIF